MSQRISGSAVTRNTPCAVLRELSRMENAGDPGRTQGGRNRVKLYTQIDGELVSHFSLREFENAYGFVMVHASVPRALELVRRDLCREAGEEVEIVITDALRTEEELRQLAQRYGWADEGGSVSRNSRHLARYGGIAVDIVARVRSSGARFPQDSVGAACRRYFDFVKDDYPDGHVHADNRYGS
jgi:hypothetical protein